MKTIIDDQWRRAKGHIVAVYVRDFDDDHCLEDVERVVQRSELTLDT